MASRNFSDDNPISEINIIPLVDIMLVVLIIFMITAPMFLKPSLNVDLPKAVTGEETLPSQMNIVISVDGDLMLNNKSVSESEIKAYASEEVKKNPDLQAIISADKDVAHGVVISIIDTVKIAGVKKFAISIEKE